ncbi:DUF4229 domain-containing protein [Nonomuraea pusilla]|uniref:DUF4229 domain-containing protein n=1 Tax=Nonomuraea pusilla TaxID=46177 RepID=A0A1H7R216_9ACTN|nr:DUF4229 domain-containing protein [Nonomuraea pusilla]SEL53975.1 Protein of unknown function [Nonomuraea pusilla]
MRPVLVYTASRIGLFVVAAGLLLLLGVQNLLFLLAASFLLSGIASYVLLSKQRDAMSARISDRMGRPEQHDD